MRLVISCAYSHLQEPKTQIPANGKIMDETKNLSVTASPIISRLCMHERGYAEKRKRRRRHCENLK
jgi:hypothetical protein